MFDSQKTKFLSQAHLNKNQGYTTCPTDVSNTLRQTYTDTTYVAPATDKQQGIRNYKDTYNMRQNTFNEVAAKGRYPTLSNVPVPTGSKNVNLCVKKMDSDRKNSYQCVPSLIPGGENKPMNTCEMTKTRNTILSRNSNFDPDILVAFNRNPLTQSLKSWA